MTTFGKSPYSLPHDENEEPTSDRRFEPRAKETPIAINVLEDEDHATPAVAAAHSTMPWFEFCL
jgi:hypothetical protein